MPDGSTFSRHPFGAHTQHPTMTTFGPGGAKHVTSEMQEAGAKALAARYTGMAMGPKEKPSLVLNSLSALGIAAATAFQEMEKVSERGARDHLQHPGVLGDADLVLWKAMSPEQRAAYMQEKAGDHLLGLAHIARRLGGGNPGLEAMATVVANNLVAVSLELQRAAEVRRRVPAERREAQRLREEAERSVLDERRQQENQARADRRRRAKERTTEEVAA